MSRVADYLHDLLAEIRLLESFVEDGEQAFYADERTQYAVMMAYLRPLAHTILTIPVHLGP